MHKQFISRSFVVALLILLFNRADAQTDSTKTKTVYVAYTFIYNVVPDGFKWPLIGFVNVARGNYNCVQLGFANTTVKNFNGLKAGFVNTVVGKSAGSQIGFINTNRKDFKGLQAGFINSVGGGTIGSQLGFINTNLKSFTGLQAGFINTSIGKVSGSQLGFINTTVSKFSGLQAGFINTSIGRTSAAQVGFVNISPANFYGLQTGFVNLGGRVRGVQIGFVNLADTISHGVPIGFLSFVRRGGYQAAEVSMNELYPVNLSLKTGVELFYTHFRGSFNSSYARQFALTVGFGSLIKLGKGIYFNPEVGNLLPMGRNNNSVTTDLALNVRYSIGPKFQVAAGPSLVWLNHPKGDNMYSNPFFAIVDHELNDRNKLLVGLRLAVSYNFSELR